MTRQQEGDEEVVKTIYPMAYYAASVRQGNPYFITAPPGTMSAGGRLSEYCETVAAAWSSARAKLPAPMQPKEETTLPAYDCTEAERVEWKSHWARKLACRERQLLAALRERDALKAERDKLLQQKHTDGVNLASLIIQRDDFKDAWHAASDLAKKQVYVAAAELRKQRNALKDEIRENGRGIDLRDGFER